MEWVFVPFDQFYSVSTSPGPKWPSYERCCRPEARGKRGKALLRDWSSAVSRWTRKCSGDDANKPKADVQRCEAPIVTATAREQIQRKIGALDAGSKRGNWLWCSLGKKK